MTFPGEDESRPNSPAGPYQRHSDTGFLPPERPPASEADFFARDPVAEQTPERSASGGGGSGFWPPAAAAASGPAAPVAAEGGGKRVRRVAWELAQTLFLAVLIFLLVRAVAQNFRVEGPSMEPGLHNGQYLLVNKAVYFKLNLGTLAKYVPFLDSEPGEEKFLFHGPQRGDVIVFRYPQDPDRDFIKRVIGVPGDRVRIDDDGTVYVNDVALEENYVAERSGRPIEEQVVPKESYFVLGDNRPNSSDSRTWGFVPEENIIGKAMFSYWPLSELGGVGNHSLDLGMVAVPLPW